MGFCAKQKAGMEIGPETERLFHEVVDLSAGARHRYFEEQRVLDEVRREVESLLEHDAAREDRLSHIVAGSAARLLEEGDGGANRRCGPYQLVRLLGRGGMGRVYLAERTDGEVAQRVAVKLLPFGAGDALRERFLQERQILAALTHTNIARMLDAGHLDNGQPFLAMEYVEGQPIDVFAANLSSRQGIALFLKVCAAVGYLHRNLVVHRDLKPSNILVTGDGEPKLLDFGISKLLSLATQSTVTSMRMLTPDYASPEQVTGGAMSTATDIYSLGAVLYQLLTGKTAHEFAERSPEAVAAIITTREVTRPGQWAPELKGDLEAILLKALRKDPQERYATAGEFAADLEAYLESRPVRARAGNAWYRTRKFVRRYWAPVCAGGLIAASLSIGLYIANRERSIAERRFLQIRQLSDRVFALDNVIKNLPGSVPARQNLVSAALEYVEGLAADARSDPDLAREVGEGYWRVARAQGVPVELNLGDEAQAEVSLKKADELMDVALAAHPKDRIALLRSAAIAHDRMILAQEGRRDTQAVAFAHRAATRLEELLRAPGLLDSERSEAAGDYTNLAMIHSNLHMYGEAASYARRAIEIARPVPSAQRHVSFGLSVLANSLRYQGDLNGALDASEEGVRVSEQITYRDEIQRMMSLTGILLREGLILGEDGGLNLGRPQEAIDVLRKAFEMPEEIAAKDPVDAASRIRAGNIGEKLGDILRHDNPAQALAVYDVAIQRLGEVPHDLRSRQDQASVLADSSYPLRSLHRSREAQERIDRAVTILKETKDYPADRVAIDGPVFVVLRAAADQVADTAGPGPAIKLYEGLIARVMAGADPAAMQNDLRNAPRLSLVYESLGRLYRRSGHVAEAQAMTERRLALWRYWDRKLPDDRFVRRQMAEAR